MEDNVMKEADYSQMTDEEFRDILEDIVNEEGANILSIGNVYVELAEYFNNEVLDRWLANNE
jgi:hypothetical protein